jgi:hypothetical protein
MLAENSVALKEWASVCAALEVGRQTVLIRKGGIDEGSRGFRIEHPEFWLYPTQFHQDAAQLAADGPSFLNDARRYSAPPGKVAISLYAIVEDVQFVRDWQEMAQFSPRHILSTEAVRQRFEYRTPGVYVARVRVYRRDEPTRIDEHPRFAGCKSWVDLDKPLPTDGLHAVTGLPAQQ